MYLAGRLYWYCTPLAGLASLLDGAEGLQPVGRPAAGGLPTAAGVPLAAVGMARVPTAEGVTWSRVSLGPAAGSGVAAVGGLVQQ